MTAVQIAIEKLLIGTGRDGIQNLIDYMERSGFFSQPCSSQYHLAVEGGLAEHSLNVCRLALMLRELLAPEIVEEKVVITSLLHDLGKSGQYGKPGYIPNMLKGRGKNADPCRSEAKPWKINPELRYVDHEVRSIQIASQYINLEEDESWAILMHNGMYGTFKYQIQGKETPLYLLLHMADMWAGRVMEKKGDGADDGEE